MLKWPHKAIKKCFKGRVWYRDYWFIEWYTECSKIIATTDSIMPDNYIPSKRIKTIIEKDRPCDGIWDRTYYIQSYYNGEVNDEGKPDGFGRIIYPYEKIQEAFWKDGHI